MTVIVETAYAKINLALHVRGRRPDGYHELETLFAFADDGDRLSAKSADGIGMTISGPFADGLSNSDNLVVRTAKLMQAHFAVGKGAAITLDKQLPVASGIGGGSADAAATARLMRRLWSIDVDDAALAQLLSTLGADVPACVQSRTVFGKGVGTALQNVSDASIRGRHVLLVNPMKPVATGPVFKAWDGVDHGALDVADPWQGALEGRNDLEKPATALCPAIHDVLEALMCTNADMVRMSGSGATCFALYSSVDALKDAKRSISNTCPDWWMMASCLR